VQVRRSQAFLKSEWRAYHARGEVAHEGVEADLVSLDRCSARENIAGGKQPAGNKARQVAEPRRWATGVGPRSGPRPATTRTNDTKEYTTMDWRHRALCRDEDPELFFPIGTSGPAVTQIEQAKSVCQRCPVVQSCLDWALRSGQDSGVWGGLSEDERRALKRRQTRTRAFTA
jgi:WhiB family redox-sensing transcriptional regulator